MSWISNTGLLTSSDMENNAKIFGDVFLGFGYSINTIAALAGNAQAESTINPGLNEVGGGGYGLFQWTPKSDLIEACSQLGISPYTDGSIQCQCLDGELFILRNQWYTSRAFISPYYRSGATSDMIGITPDQFKTNTMGWNPDKLAILFMAAYERPSYDPDTNHSEKRTANANYWYEYYTGNPPTPTPPTPGKGIPKELIAILSSKRGLHKL
nr:MAG TPA_asm: Morphogenesis protein 1 wall, phi29, hydrolase, infection [Caudoviricetes sp.]